MKLKSFDNYIFAQLQDPEFAMLYLNEAYADSVEEFLVALHKYVQANGGVARTAELAHISRDALTALLSNTDNPELRSIRAVLQSLGLGFTIGRLNGDFPTADASDRRTSSANRSEKEAAAAGTANGAFTA